MNALPVIVREMRLEARSPYTFSLRLMGASILLGVLAFFWLTTSSFSPNAGDRLFLRLHLTLFCSIWILVPLATADCISRERREHTLGLLFLTPLTPLDIVVAKGLVHGLRALTFGLAVIPVLAVPLLMGGLSWATVLMSAIVNFAALCWALAAGMLASASSKTRPQGLAVAASFAFFFVLLLGILTGSGFVAVIPGGWSAHMGERLLRGLWINTQLADWSLFSNPLVRSGPGRGVSAPALLWVTGKAAILSGFGLALALLAAARIIRQGWQDKPPSKSWIWFQRVFCTPFILRAFFNRWIRRKLETNPIGWLEQRQWTGRTAIAAWLAVIIAFYIVMLQDSSLYHRITTQVQTAMSWMLAISLAVSATGSFRRERELGVMELLLITPLGAPNIALGRLRGIWEQFFPAAGLMLGVWIYIAATFGNASDWPRIVFSAVTFVTVPVIGLYFSLKERNLIAALAWTLFIGIFLPILLPTAPSYLATLMFSLRLRAGAGVWLLAAGCQVVLALLYGWRLQQTLATREFPMDIQ